MLEALDAQACTASSYLVALGRAGRGAAAAGPGQIRPRPGTGREPEFPPPKITDYKPKSTLVVPEHPVPRAKFPVVDIHGHPAGAREPAKRFRRCSTR